MTTLKDLLKSADPLRHEAPPTQEQWDRSRTAVLARPPRVDANPATRRRWVPFSATVAVASLVIVIIGAVLWPRTGSVAEAAVRFEIRLAEDRPAPGLSPARVGVSNRTIYLYPESIVTNGDVEQSDVVPGDTSSHFWIDVRLSAAGAQKMRQATMNHVGRPVAILVDGEVVTAPTVKSAIGAAAVISGDYSRADAQRIAKGMKLKF